MTGNPVELWFTMAGRSPGVGQAWEDDPPPAVPQRAERRDYTQLLRCISGCPNNPPISPFYKGGLMRNMPPLLHTILCAICPATLS